MLSRSSASNCCECCCWERTKGSENTTHHVIQFAESKMHYMSDCATSKATCLLSCLWMEIVSLEWTKTKCNIWERFGSRSLGAIFSLLRWTMLLCKELTCQLWTCYPLGNDYLTTTARVVWSRTKHVLIACNDPNDTTVTWHLRWSCIIRDDASLLFWATFYAVSEQ